MEHIKLKSLTFSKKCKAEVKALLPNFVSYRKVFIDTLTGYCHFLCDKDGNDIGQCYRFRDTMLLTIRFIAKA